MGADATASNLEAFDRVYTTRARLRARFQYNLEAARKEFRAMLRTAGIRRTGQRVLDVGFGSGMLMFEFDRGCRIRGVELSRSALESAVSSARRLGYGDAEFVPPRDDGCLPYPDASFTVVIASHVVEHVEDDVGLLRDLLRVLAPGGWLVLIGPLDATNDGPLDEQVLVNPGFAEGHFHVRNYNLESFVARVERAGGQVVHTAVSMAAWDWKVRGDGWRRRVLGWPGGWILDRAIAAALNVPLSLLPRPVLRVVDRAFEVRGYRPRQVALAVRHRRPESAAGTGPPAG